MSNYTSNAEWPEGSVCLDNIENITTDKHSTYQEAQSVCEKMQRDGFGGEGKVFPVRVWVGESTPAAQQFTVGRRNPGHWDIHTKDGRAFCIRGGPGHYVVRDEREGKGANDTRNSFKTVSACMVYICDELMHELIVAEGQEVKTIESWNVPRA